MNLVGPLVFVLLVGVPLLYKTGYLDGFLNPDGDPEPEPNNVETEKPRNRPSTRPSAPPSSRPPPNSRPSARPPVTDAKRAGKVKMIITTDSGIDDADAIILALSSKNVEVLAITTNYGSVDRDKVTANVNRVLRLFPDKKIPVYAGATTPMKWRTGDIEGQVDHGPDGLGNVPTVDPASQPGDAVAVAGKNAPDAIYNIVKHNPGTVIVCIGALTDFAMAIDQRPELATHPHLDHVYILGGNAPGDQRRAAASFFRDPDAAEVLLTRLERPITLITKDAYGDFIKPSPEFEAQYMNTDSQKGKFVQATRGFWVKAGKKPPRLMDEIAMAVAIDPVNVVKQSKMEENFVTVDLDQVRNRKGKIIRGQTSTKKRQNVEYISEVRFERVEQMLVDSLKETRMCIILHFICVY